MLVDSDPVSCWKDSHILLHSLLHSNFSSLRYRCLNKNVPAAHCSSMLLVHFHWDTLETVGLWIASSHQDESGNWMIPCLLLLLQRWPDDSCSWIFITVCSIPLCMRTFIWSKRNLDMFTALMLNENEDTVTFYVTYKNENNSHHIN